jgi:hypothetical protein
MSGIIFVAPLFSTAASCDSFRAPCNEDGLRDLNALSPVKSSELVFVTPEDTRGKR